MEADKLLVKENVVRREPLSARWLAAACALAAAALAAAALVDVALPAPLARDAPPHRFIADIAHDHLVNLTSIGPRVAGSYENEVLGVGVVVAAVKAIARGAGPHVRLDLHVQTASGAFPLGFLDGMNHVYQDVSNVAVRVSAAGAAAAWRGAGAGAGEARSALLLNCHIDTVPDSPGASDDGAGCAVLLETLRALAAARSPPRRAAIFLFNGAEENVLQASHGFITHHKWARSVRAFINIEACGAGGREVLFQAGPHDPWIVEMYAGAVPHPFASSLAQELFESGLIPADTDFRIFRDFGNLSGVDLAWSANGYVYHTALDTAERVGRAALQRTGDNVLALVHGLLASPSLESAVERSARQPVFFDVLGALVVSARAPAALLAAALALALAALDVHLTAAAAADELFISRGAWWRAASAGAAAWAAAWAAGLAAAGALGSALHALGVRLSFYSRPWLLAPLYALPALLVAGVASRALAARWLRARGAWRGWWAARALQQGGTLCAAAALAGCALRGLRSGFLPWLWTALPAGAGVARALTGGRSGARWAVWSTLGAVLPMLQTWYLALGSLRMMVPLAGRAGAGALPPDAALGVLTAALALGACGWLLPLALATRAPRRLAAALAALVGAALVLAARAPAYGADTPQRVMVFHTRRTLHAADADADVVETFYWIPQLDVNTPRSLAANAEELAAARAVPAAECARWPYCGMPFYLPVLRLLGAGLRAPAASAPAVRLRARLALRDLNATHAALQVTVEEGPAHVVLALAPAVGARLAWCSALAAAPLESAAGLAGSARKVYFFALHSARAPHAPLSLVLAREGRGGGGAGGAGRGTLVSLAGHALFGARARSEALERLLRRLPAWTAPTGWSVDLHLYRL